MNEQQAFDKVWNYFIIERNSLGGSGKACYYRGPQGEKCAIGCLLPDDMYRRDMEEKSALALFAYNGIAEFFDECRPRFLQNLQSQHDRAVKDKLSGYNWFDSFQANLIHLAHDNNLNVPK